jgi:hypothetical protein
MLPLLKYIQNMKKLQTKLRAYISTFYVRMTKFHEKPIFLVLLCKKDKNMSC